MRRVSVVNPWILDMWWRDVAFLHWRADAAQLRARLPSSLEIDTHQGDAWLSVVPFRMTDVRPRFGPVLPGFGHVPELNLRTYVRANGKPGIWFFSLDATSPLLVRAARLVTALPYYDARIATSQTRGAIRYTSERDARGVPAGRFDAEYTPGESVPTVHGSLDAFLHERYTFFAMRFGRLLTADVRHAPWKLRRLDVRIAENSLGATSGHVLDAPPALARFGREVHVHATATLPARP